MSAIRIVFMGSAELACASLQAMLDLPGAKVLAVVTQPDKPKGRDLLLSPTPVGALAESAGLPVLKPRRARDPEFIRSLVELAPDLMIVVAYGQILPQTLLDVPAHGCLNVHTSLLPKFRGAAPIQWAIVDGETETGVTIMKMDAGLDTGAVVSEARTPIDDEDTGRTLHDRLAVMGADLLKRTVPEYVAGKLTPVPQPEEGSTYARKISKDDGRLQWGRSARDLFNQVRGFNPWPGAFTHWRDDGRSRLLKIWKTRPAEGKGDAGEILKSDGDGLVVACGDGALRILELQKEGSRRMDAAEFLRGQPLPVGLRLG